MEALKAKRASLKSQFTRSENRLMEVLDDISKFPTATIQRRYKEYQTKWNAVQEVHDSLVAEFPDDIAEETENAWIAELSSRFDVLEVKADKAIESIGNKLAPVYVEKNTFPYFCYS